MPDKPSTPPPPLFPPTAADLNVAFAGRVMRHGRVPSPPAEPPPPVLVVGSFLNTPPGVAPTEDWHHEIGSATAQRQPEEEQAG